MPDMFEIYQSHAPRYHELVMAEDHANNLGALLHQLVDWKGKSVLEAGVGTGRVTQLYIADAADALCCDQSAHMLAFARRSLAAYSPKLTFQLADNENLPMLESRFEIFIEGWSFGHSIMACANEAEIIEKTDLLLRNASRNLRLGGKLFIIETMGTNVLEPAPPEQKLGIFYQALVDTHTFKQYIISTDYRFPDNQKAAEIMGFFFGDEMKRSVLERGTNTIPEWTGVWVGNN